MFGFPGATSGIGAETARVLAKQGARLVLPARNMKAAEDTKALIVSEFPDSQIIVMALDLSSLNSVRSFVAEFESLNLPLNLLMYLHATNSNLFICIFILYLVPKKRKETDSFFLLFTSEIMPESSHTSMQYRKTE